MDHYQVLGVRREASEAEIRRAYQKRARQLHPDLNPGDPVATERFEAVSRAFETAKRSRWKLNDCTFKPSIPLRRRDIPLTTMSCG